MTLEPPQSVSPRPNPTSRVVVPAPLRWPQRLVASLIYYFIRAVTLTLRFHWNLHPDLLVPRKGPHIFVAWHNRLPLSLFMYREYARRQKQPFKLAALVSASKDGGVAARVLEHFRVQPVRGSSSRRGAQAMLELTTWAERGYDLALTPDGPRGPCYGVQPGPIAISSVTGSPIIPGSYYLHWKIRLRSWDRFQIPLPFSRVDLHIGAPVVVPTGATEEERETIRIALQTQMQAMTKD